MSHMLAVTAAKTESATVASHSNSSKVTPLRVLHVHSGNLFGGVESMLITQAREQVHLPGLKLSFALCFDGRLSEELKTTGSAVHSLGAVRISQPLSVQRARRHLGDLLRREKFDVVVTHSCWTQAIFGATARANSLPVVFYMHGPANGRHWLERWARRTRPDKILCNSHFTAASSGTLYPGARTEVVYCPVGQSQSEFSKTERAETRAEFQTPTDATVIIQVSRMERWKGHIEHIEALSRLADLPSWVCWQVGGAQSKDEDEYLRSLKETTKRLGIADRVRFLDQRTDVDRLLTAADIYCQPNTGPEPFGITLIEALYARLPVVTTDGGAAREIVDESCGVLVQPGEVNSLANALRRLILEPTRREQLGNKGPARARSLCDPHSQLQMFTNTLGLVSKS